MYVPWSRDSGVSAHKSFLAFSKSRSIGFASVEENPNPNAPFDDIEDRDSVQNVVGLSFDFKTQRLFYSDIQLGVIMAVNFNGKNPHKVAVGKSPAESS